MRLVYKIESNETVTDISLVIGDTIEHLVDALMSIKNHDAKIIELSVIPESYTCEHSGITFYTQPTRVIHVPVTGVSDPSVQ